MATIARMPALAANTPQATLIEWLVNEGATVTAGDPIATVETAKATVDIEAEADGVVLRLVVDEGVDVQVGAPIIVIGVEGETVDDAAVSGEAPEHVGQEPATGRSREDYQAEDLVPVKAPQSNDERQSGNRIFGSPLARKLTKDASLELGQIEGTGPLGRIVRRDVVAAIIQAKSATAAAPDPSPSSRRTLAPSRDGAWTDTPHSRLRRAIAARLTESKRAAPHFYVRGIANVTELLALRGRLNSDADGRFSVNDLVVKAVAKAHHLVPRMNVIWTEDAVRTFDHVDVAVAVATAEGLLTPVVRKVESLSLSALAEATRDFAERARRGVLRPDELEGGTVTVSNLGMYGTQEFVAIINPPHASILAVGAAVDGPVVVDGSLTVGKTITFTLSVDHRPVDGAVAAEWMREFVGLIENPMRLVL